MSAFRFEALANNDAARTTLDAVSFLIREVRLQSETDRTVTADDIEDDLYIARQNGYVYYGLFGPHMDLVAAACVGHNRNDKTYVWEIAVHPDQWRQGIGREIMRHIALTAIEREDTLLVADCLKEAKPFFYKLGFSAADDSQMVATPNAVLVT